MKEDTLFRHALGDSPTIRVLELLIEGRELDHSLTDITEIAGVGWTTLHRLWPNLVGAGLVKQTRTIGRAKLYRLNLDSKTARQLVKLFETLIMEAMPKDAGELATATVPAARRVAVSTVDNGEAP